METNQYLNVFIDESRDHLQKLNENLLQLEQNPHDIGIVQEIFRSAHTLKGMSATMGFEDIASLTHEMENVLDLVRHEKLEMNNDIFDAMFKSLDFLETMVQDITDGGEGKSDVSETVHLLKSTIQGGGSGSKAPSSAAIGSADKGLELDEYQYSVLEQSLQTGFKVYYAKVIIRQDCILKAARAYMVFDVLERHGEVVKSSPSVQEIEQEKLDNDFTVYYISKMKMQELEQLIMNISEIDSVQIVPMDVDSLQQLLRTSKAAVQPDRSKTQQAAREKSASSQADTSRHAPQVSRSIRVDIERLDTLMNLFSELLIDRVRLESLADEIKRDDLTGTIEHMTRVSTDLQNIVLKLRMVPVDTVFNRFPRMIRDLAKSLDKKIELVISGAETELDRTVIDEIGDPLVHLLRNSLDHGLEPVVERIAAGKSESGTIHLSAYHSGNHVFIEIEDDGRGIQRDKVLKVALKNGLVTEEEAQNFSDAEVFQLLFASGFSTADKISDISGRGVGLDVVNTKISSLGGHVTVESKIGVGSKFTVQLPLTLSIISAMLVAVRGEKYAIPLSSIVETSIIRPDQIRNVQGRRVIEYRAGVIPIIPLGDLLECPAQEGDGDADELEIVVIRKGEKMAALIVDDFIGQQEIVLKTLGKYLTNVFVVSGATILGDGQVALILDPNAIIK